ncbi:hypothetical protein KKC13_11590 [bacterium]|nr:hypothetical protein [bacterium]MBU1957904.1 hypothetical protein [bacterium]
MKVKNVLFKLLLGWVFFMMYANAEENVLLGQWQVDRSEAEKSIEAYTEDEDIAFLLSMMLNSVETIQFSEEGSCTLKSNKENSKRQKCWERHENVYTFYNYSGNEVGKIEVLDDNHVQMGLSDENFPEVLLFQFIRVYTMVKND